MAKLLITTQVYENYGAHAWDGKGDCPQYWKAKGSNDYMVRKFRGREDAATVAVMALRSQIEEDNDHYRETVIDFRVVKDDHLTEFEQSQLDYEGKITCPPKQLEW